MSLNILKNINLAAHTSWLVGGEAEYYFEPTNFDELKEALQWAKQNQFSFTVLGGGSNVLISDKGIRGLVIGLKRFSQIEVQTDENKIYIKATSGTSKSELLRVFLKYKLQPALFLAGLPGDVGGGVVMNAGVAEGYQPREFMDFVDSIEILNIHNFNLETLTKDQLQIKYRHTDGWQPHVITRVSISWELKPSDDLLQKVKDANKNRLQKQPLDKPSCGSVFKNPEGYKAAQLIEQCGLKGFQIGEAQVSLKHANFIVNLGEATASDIWSVIQFVKKTVWEKKNVELSTEVVRLGDWT